jgi:hypothetical protein
MADPLTLDVLVRAIGTERAGQALEHMEAEKALERARSRYQTAWELIFRSHGLDFRDWKVTLDEAEERLEIGYVGQHG